MLINLIASVFHRNNVRFDWQAIESETWWSLQTNACIDLSIDDFRILLANFLRFSRPLRQFKPFRSSIWWTFENETIFYHCANQRLKVHIRQLRRIHQRQQQLIIDLKRSCRLPSDRKRGSYHIDSDLSEIVLIQCGTDRRICRRMGWGSMKDETSWWRTNHSTRNVLQAHPFETRPFQPTIIFTSHTEMNVGQVVFFGCHDAQIDDHVAEPDRLGQRNEDDSSRIFRLIREYIGLLIQIDLCGIDPKTKLNSRGEGWLNQDQENHRRRRNRAKFSHLCYWQHRLGNWGRNQVGCISVSIGNSWRDIPRRMTTSSSKTKYCFYFVREGFLIDGISRMVMSSIAQTSWLSPLCVICLHSIRHWSLSSFSSKTIRLRALNSLFMNDPYSDHPHTRILGLEDRRYRIDQWWSSAHHSSTRSVEKSI